MFIAKEDDFGRIVIVGPRKTKDRLAGTCFRGQPFNRAGNFCHWRDLREVFNNEFVMKSILDDINEAFAARSQTNSICIPFAFDVGWSGTDDRSKYQGKDLELYAPNRKSSVLRVLPDRKHLLAPKTKLLTIIYELQDEGHQLGAYIKSAYPGKDIGELKGNLTSREDIVFFDWNHPGEA